MTQSIANIDELRAAMDGEVTVPSDPGYDEARRVWNADIDRRPAVIARCASSADVVTAVGLARDSGLDVAIRSGAHSTSGLSTTDGGVVIDLSALKDVAVDPQARRVRVGGGALLGDVDAATLAHGLATPFGLISHTGVGGLTLGGGMGWLTRKFGLSVDNLVSAEVVTADGRVLRASPDSHPDLFWALRGGGGNFGVVTEFEFRLHVLNPMVDLGLFFWSLDQGAEALRLMREVVATLGPDLNVVVGALNAPPAPFVPPEHHLAPGYVLLLTGFDGTPAHAEAVARIRETLPPLFDMVTPMPYVALQQMLDEGNAWGFHAYVTATYIEDLSDEVIDVLTEHATRKSSPMSAVLMYRLDGAFSKMAEGDTAFGGGRSPRFCVFLIGFAPDPDLLAADRKWVRDLRDALRPLAVDDGYINDLVEFEDDRVRSAYGSEKYTRLARVKAEYDPGNLFHRNANIKPA